MDVLMGERRREATNSMMEMIQMKQMDFLDRLLVTMTRCRMGVTTAMVLSILMTMLCNCDDDANKMWNELNSACNTFRFFMSRTLE